MFCSVTNLYNMMFRWSVAARKTLSTWNTAAWRRRRDARAVGGSGHDVAMLSLKIFVLCTEMRDKDYLLHEQVGGSGK